MRFGNKSKALKWENGFLTNSLTWKTIVYHERVYTLRKDIIINALPGHTNFEENLMS